MPLVLPGEQPIRDERLPHHDPSREHVGAAIHLTRADLLGRHVGELALHLSLACGLEPTTRLGHAEVEHAREPVRTHEDVLRGDVAMHDAEQLPRFAGGLVGRVEAVQHLRHHGGHHLHRRWLVAMGEEAPERLAVHVLEHERQLLVLRHHVERRHHVGVLDPRAQARFVEQRRHQHRRLGEARVQSLDGDDAAEAHLPTQPPEVHRGHASGCDGAVQLVAPHHGGRLALRLRHAETFSNDHSLLDSGRMCDVTVSRFALAALVALACWGVPRAAHADDTQEQAEKLFRESADHYREGRFEKAISLLQEAYALTGEPVLLYNLGRAYEGNGDLDKAVAAYRRYLDQSDAIQDRGAIERRIATLEKQIAERKELEKKAALEKKRADSAEARQEEPSPNPAPWILVGLGSGGVVAGTVLGVLASARESEAIDEAFQVEADALRSEAETLALAANVTLAVGGAIALGGLVWGIVDIVLLDDGTTEAALRVAPGWASLHLRF